MNLKEESDKMLLSDEMPEVACPKCGELQQDFDGFGVVFCESCGYCVHPSWSFNESRKRFACEVCGKLEDE